MIVAGVGCRSEISAEQIESAIAAAAEQSRVPTHQISLIAIPATRSTERGIQLVAAARGVPIVLVPQPALEAEDSRTVTRSQRSKDAMNVHSVAEAAALAAAGPGGRLLAPRIAVGPVTCALAEGSIPS